MRTKAALLAAGASLSIALGAGAPTRAAVLAGPSVPIVGDAHGFRPVSARLSRPGSVEATFQGPLGIVRLTGSPGASISFDVMPPDAAGRGTIGIRVKGSAPGPSGGGVPTENLAGIGLRSVSATPTPAGGTPWASSCLDINVLGGDVQGSACSNVYKKHVNGLDWYLSNEYWASASLSAWQGPLGLHLQGVAFETTWQPGNTIYSVAPTTTQSFGTCTPWTVSTSGTNSGITVGASITGQICPSTLGPWNLRLGANRPNSGAIWTGNVQGMTNYQGSEGVQLVHNPPGVAAAWNDYYAISYCTGVCF